MLIQCAHTDIVDVDSLIPNPKNPNKHPEKQIQMLAKIIKYQGQRLPIVVSKRSGFIVSGHGRLEALKLLGEKQCAIDRQDFASEADEYAHMIADNKIAELSEHDDAMMIEDLKAFPTLDFDLLGMPDFKIDNQSISDSPVIESNLFDENKFIVVIELDCEVEQKNIYEKLTNEGYKCKLIM